MRPAALPCLFAFVSGAFAQVDNSLLDGFSPYIPPLAFLDSRPVLAKRAGCPAGYGGCDGLGNAGLCCPTGTNCAFDEARHIACCPYNVYCTGVIGVTAIPASPTSQAGGSSSGITAPPAGVAGGGSTVPNSFFPYISMPTSYANSNLCYSYWTSCQIESASCSAVLAGQNAVTVNAPGGGITVVGASITYPAATASSICSSLSHIACYDFQSTDCTIFGAGVAAPTSTIPVVTINNPTTSFNFLQTFTPNAGPRATGCPEMLYAIGAGAVVGAAGALI